ncbi:MAG: tRNA guanosine(34) transglycosylase Tgt [Chloroflexota bacterium]
MTGAIVESGGTISLPLWQFEITATDRATHARLGRLTMRHGSVETPVFMPVGSQATVKSVTPEEVNGAGGEIILCNSYHLYLRPGVEVVRSAGGLHAFMGWNGGIITDSGGFQVFSLAGLRKLDDDGVTFRSHIDGSEHRLTPESSVAIQEGLGADIIMALDDVPAGDASEARVWDAVDRTYRWAERCLKAQTRADQALFAIVQGGRDLHLRAQSARALSALDLPGYAIGGLSVGEAKSTMYSVLASVAPLLPEHKPRYLMGVGAPDDLVEAVSHGVDMFDCVLPTRVARNGAVYTSSGRRNIRHACFKLRGDALEQGCDCYTCRTFSAGYVHHLFRCEELLAYRLATLHNLRFMHRLMNRMKDAIKAGEFSSFREEFVRTYVPSNEDVRLASSRRRGDSSRSPDPPLI